MNYIMQTYRRLNFVRVPNIGNLPMCIMPRIPVKSNHMLESRGKNMTKTQVICQST